LLRAHLLFNRDGVARGAPVYELRKASEADLPSVRRLLEDAGLPTSDLATAESQFVVIGDGEQIIAAGALQRFGSVALLRSVVVDPDRRGAAFGRGIVKELERAAQAAQIGRLVLLTQTAREFFADLGYRVIERADAPQEVQRSEEFRSLCPSSATCMIKTIGKSDQAVS
jgi:N-acetylglutamate synthase-like GNAT family acetyltransferase